MFSNMGINSLVAPSTCTTNSQANMRSDPNHPYSTSTMMLPQHHIQLHYGQYPPPQALHSNGIRVQLEDKDLWTSFYNITNEMILTKAGRRTFPLIKVRIHGLDETELYTVQIEFRIADQFKYRFLNGEWKTTPRNDSFKQGQQQAVIHQHTDSPNFGHHWAKDVVVFGKLKLTNNENTRNPDAVYLKSLNKYEPVIHIFKHDKKNVDDKVLVYSKAFVETQFIAVTAYQNENITNLKIKHNPFAKAFLNNKPTITIDSERKVIINDSSDSKPILDNYNSRPIQAKPLNTLPTPTHSNFSELLPQAPTHSNWYNYYAAAANHHGYLQQSNIYQQIHNHQYQHSDSSSYTANYNPANYNRFFTPYPPNPYHQPESAYQFEYQSHQQQQTSEDQEDEAVAGYVSNLVGIKRSSKDDKRDSDERPSKRAHLVGSLDVSPVYGNNGMISKLELNDHQSDDDSLTSNGDNFASSASDPLHQSTSSHSANSSSSFAMSSSIVSS